MKYSRIAKTFGIQAATLFGGRQRNETAIRDLVTQLSSLKEYRGRSRESLQKPAENLFTRCEREVHPQQTSKPST